MVRAASLFLGQLCRPAPHVRRGHSCALNRTAAGRRTVVARGQVSGRRPRLTPETTSPSAARTVPERIQQVTHSERLIPNVHQTSRRLDTREARPGRAALRTNYRNSRRVIVADPGDDELLIRAEEAGAEADACISVACTDRIRSPSSERTEAVNAGCMCGVDCRGSDDRRRLGTEAGMPAERGTRSKSVHGSRYLRPSLLISNSRVERIGVHAIGQCDGAPVIAGGIRIIFPRELRRVHFRTLGRMELALLVPDVDAGVSPKSHPVMPVPTTKARLILYGFPIVAKIGSGSTEIEMAFP